MWKELGNERAINVGDGIGALRALKHSDCQPIRRQRVLCGEMPDEKGMGGSCPTTL